MLLFYICIIIKSEKKSQKTGFALPLQRCFRSGRKKTKRAIIFQIALPIKEKLNFEAQNELSFTWRKPCGWSGVLPHFVVTMNSPIVSGPGVCSFWSRRGTGISTEGVPIPKSLEYKESFRILMVPLSQFTVKVDIKERDRQESTSIRSQKTPVLSEG